MYLHCSHILLKIVNKSKKKRHLGNDIVVIIFNESSKPFSPQTIQSEFNHIYAVVQPLPKLTGEKQKYKIGFASKSGVPPFGPLLNDPAIYEQGPEFRKFFLIKLFNAERAACSGPSFFPKLRRTRKMLLEEISKKYVK